VTCTAKFTNLAKTYIIISFFKKNEGVLKIIYNFATDNIFTIHIEQIIYGKFIVIIK
jgi:hypothetical protein